MKALRVVGNSIAFVIILGLGITFLEINPLLGVLIFLTAIDQLEDVYEAVEGRRLIPINYIFIDIPFEVLSLFIGVYLFLLGLVYYMFFETPVMIMMFLGGLAIIYSSVKDIASDLQYFPNILKQQPIPQQIKQKGYFKLKK